MEISANFACYRSLGREEPGGVAPSSEGEARTATHRIGMSTRCASGVTGAVPGMGAESGVRIGLLAVHRLHRIGCSPTKNHRSGDRQKDHEPRQNCIQHSKQERLCRMTFHGRRLSGGLIAASIYKNAMGSRFPFT